MEINATPDTIHTTSPIKCKKCKRYGTTSAVPVWDDPGDCVPIIQKWVYKVWCPVCHIETAEVDYLDAAIVIWNEFMK